MHLSTAQQDTLIRQLVYAAIYFLCLIAFYINIGQDMGAGYFLPILVPMVAVLMLVQHATALPLFTKTGLVHLFAGLGWATAFPLLYTWTYNSVWYQSLICFDAVIGTAIWVTLTGLTGVLAKAPGKKLWAALLSVLDFLFLAVPFIVICKLVIEDIYRDRLETKDKLKRSRWLNHRTTND